MRTTSRTGWLLVALAAVVLGLGAACGGDDEDGGAAGTTATTIEETQPKARAGLVSDVGRFNDRSFNQSALEGLNRARDELGADVRAVESRAAGDYVPPAARRSFSRSPAAAASARSTRRGSRASGASASTATSPTSARTFSPAP